MADREGWGFALKKKCSAQHIPAEKSRAKFLNEIKVLEQKSSTKALASNSAQGIGLKQSQITTACLV